MESSILIAELRRMLLVAIQAPGVNDAALKMVLLISELITAIENEEEPDVS